MAKWLPTKMLPAGTGRLSILALFLMPGLQHRVQAQAGVETEIRYLSGTDKDHTVDWEFFCTAGRNSGFWTTIPVPSCWEQQGFGHYDYGRDYRTYGKNFRFSDEKGLYRYRFDAPESWNGKSVYLVFEGAMTDTEVSLNGQSTGPVHQGAFYQFRYDISGLLRYGQSNLLEATVSKMSENASVNAAERYADYWIFGGLFRPVYLEIFPKEHIERTAVAADAAGNFSVDVFLQNITGARTLTVDIFDPTGKRIAQQSESIARGASKAVLKCNIPDPERWSSEAPNLYSTVVHLKNGETELHRATTVFGFRTIEIRQGDGVYINGSKIKFKGINRHCFWPESGRTLSRSIDRMDVELLKAMNMNAVRCSHYPPDQAFLELCDSVGLYVLDELAGWQSAYDTTVGEKLVREMVIRDVNHPSIVFWSNGNEGGTNKDLDDDFLLYDPSQRPVIHAHHKPGNDFNGIETNHYEKFYSTKDILDDSLIYIPTEFLHAQDDGGGAAGLHDFWELMWTAPRSGGGFIWAMLDEGVARTDLGGYVDVNRVNAPDGVLGPHREKEGSFYALKEIFSPIAISKQALPANFKGRLAVENRYHFTNLNACTFTAALVNFNGPEARLAGHDVKKSFAIPGPAVPPGKSGLLNIPLPADWKNYDGLQVQAFGSDGREVLRWTWAIDLPEKVMKELVFGELPIQETVEFEDQDSVLILRTENCAIQFDKISGLLKKVEYKLGLSPSFGNGPVLVAGQASPAGVRHYPEPDGYVLEFQYGGALKMLKWKLFANGWLQLDYEYKLEPGAYPFTGVSFDFPESNIIGVKWLGNGPRRVWKNRMQGGNLDVWESMYNNTHTGNAPWAYPEFKGYFSEITWMEFNTVEGKILVVSPQPRLFVRLFDFYGLSGPVPHPVLPVGDISFLDGIPPIGTKLATGLDTQTEGLGPQSELNKGGAPQRRTLYFYFGTPPAR